jgi:hypothetical protein
MILQVRKKIQAAFFTFFLRVYILLAQSGKPGIGRDLADLIAQDFVRNLWVS